MGETGEKSIALIGGGPAALFMYKRLVDAGRTDYHIHIFERNSVLGKGMPYSEDGANEEHLTNVSDSEIPELVESMEEWLRKAPDDLQHRFNINPLNFNELKVIPRLFLGEYLSAQFNSLLRVAKEKNIKTTVFNNTLVRDVRDDPKNANVVVISEKGELNFDQVVICTGHKWPQINEGKIKGYFDSPYPPEKLKLSVNYPVAIRGSSLTALDAIKTLSKQNGCFLKDKKGKLYYKVNKKSERFKVIMHSLNGLLPAIRIHLDDSLFSMDLVMTSEEIHAQRKLNDGFVSLDYLFEKKFKAQIREKDLDFYDRIKDMSLEEFIEEIMKQRERLDPFTLFNAEYVEAEKSIRNLEPVHWKEMLAVLSFIVNYPAKYFSAEDMLRVNNVLMPLVSIVIAFVPQSSAQELLALHEAGILSIIAVDKDSRVEIGKKEGITYRYFNEHGEEKAVGYKMFVDCVGQPELSIHEIPFKGLVEMQTVSEAKLLFRLEEEALKLNKEGNKEVKQETNGTWYLKVPGIMINDNFQVINDDGENNDRIYVMAVPYIGGINPDYSGLDFCEAASAKIISALPLRTDEGWNEIK